MSTEAECYLLRKTSLTLEAIGKLTPAQFNAILTEVHFQELVEDYSKQYQIASLLAAIYNTIPRKSGSRASQPKDFMAGAIPERIATKPVDIKPLAKEKGIILPKE